MILRTLLMASSVLGGLCGAAGAEALRVMTYNIHHGEGMDKRLDLDRIVRIIREASPAVVCLQEVDRNLPRTRHLDFPRLLAEKLGMNVVFENNYAFDGGEYGNATLTSLKIVSHENYALPNPKQREPRGCLRTTVVWQGREVDIWNAHLGLDPEERTVQAQAILGFMRESARALLGDMNEDAEGQGMRLFMTKLVNAISPAAGHKKKQIDYILASKGGHILSSRILDTPEAHVASDHLPCWADLDFNPPETVPLSGGGTQ